MNSVYLILAFFLCGGFAEKLNSCVTPNEEAASCVRLLNCPVLLSIATRIDPVTAQFFQKSLCDEKTSMVCCGTHGNYTTIPTIVNSCTTPNEEAASCVSLLKCPVLLSIAASIDPLTSQFFQKSLCDEETSTVCCGTHGNYTTIPIAARSLSKVERFRTLPKEKRKSFVLEKLLPSQTYCGFQHTDDYFYNDTETSVDEFPWMVYIIHGVLHDTLIYHLRVESNCAGALISNRYVISTVDCSTAGWHERAFDGIDMMLGVHHVHKNINCIGTRYGVDDCTKPSLRVSSTQWKVYEEVILFRLTTSIKYNDYTRAICLPFNNNEIPKAGSLVLASGWGEEEFVKGKSLKLKKRMKYIVMNDTECEPHNPIKHPICGIPSETNIHYFCTGDIGGPLMYKLPNKNWFAVGLLRSAYRVCNEGQPVTATRLTPEILNWIIENLEP